MNLAIVKPGIQPPRGLREVAIVPATVESIEINKCTVVVTLRRRRKRFHFGHSKHEDAKACYDKLVRDLQDA